MLGRVKIVVDTYLENAKGEEFKLGLFTYNRKAEGIKRATKYWANISKNYTPDDGMTAEDAVALDKRLVEKVYQDVIAAAGKGELESSTDLRTDLVFALFDKLGWNELRVETLLAQLNKANQEFIIASAGSGVGVYGGVRPATALDDKVLGELTKMMKVKGYSVVAVEKDRLMMDMKNK